MPYKNLLSIAIITGTFLLSFPITAKSFTIYNMGEVKIYRYNEIFNDLIPTNLIVWAGYDEDEKSNYVRLDVDTGLKTLEMGYSGNEWKPWIYNINKSIEWAKIAKDNKIDYKKKLNNCDSWNAECYANFSAWSDGEKANMNLLIIDKSNEFFEFNGHMPLDSLIKLKKIMDSVSKKWNELEDKFHNKPVINKDELFK